MIAIQLEHQPDYTNIKGKYMKGTQDTNKFVNYKAMIDNIT